MKFRETAVLASICKESLVDFIYAFWEEVPGSGKLIWNWHLDVLCDELQTVAQRVHQRQPKLYDVVVNQPPGTSKSTVCSILYPVWVWTFFPEARILTASHTDNLVLDLANKSRYVLKSEKYRACFPHIQLRDDQDTKSYYANTLGGDRLTCTVAGKSPLGFHGHLLLVDDALDPKKAISEAELKIAKDFFDIVLPGRKVDKSVAVTFLIQQRIHLQDPAGHLLERAKRSDAARIRHICLPAEEADNISPPELREKYIDGLLDPIRLPLSVLKEFKATLGTYGYSAQFGQAPIPLSGGMFRESFFSQRVPAAPYQCTRIRYWDRAATLGGGCATAGTLMARDATGCFYVENVVQGHWNPDQRDAIIVATAQRDRSRYGPHHEPTIVIEREPGSSGIDSYQYIARKLAGYPVVADRPTGSKETRAHPWASQCACGNVHLVSDDTWDIPGWIQEHCLFPAARLKDRVDSASGAFNKLAQARPAPTLRSFTLTSKRDRKPTLKIIVCSRDELAHASLTQRCLLVCISDPAPLGNMDLPQHELTNVVAVVSLQFVDLDPALPALQEKWHQPLPPYGKPPGELVMSRQDGKRLWAAITKPDSGIETIIVVDEGERRALSVAYALAYMFRDIKPSLTKVSDPDWQPSASDDVPNPHVFELTKASRHLVC